MVVLHLPLGICPVWSGSISFLLLEWEKKVVFPGVSVFHTAEGIHVQPDYRCRARPKALIGSSKQKAGRRHIIQLCKMNKAWGSNAHNVTTVNKTELYI